jgi:rhamnose transport system substrate-binding protein
MVYVAKNVGNPYFDSINRGFQQAAEELGFTFTHVGPPTAEATSQIPLIQQQVQRGVHVLAISPNSIDALNQTFRRARDRGVIVLSVNSDITGSENFRDGAILPMDFNLTGSSQIELLGSLIDYQGKFAILSATTDAPDQNFWIRGMREALKEPKYEKMELVTVVYGDDDPQKSLVEAEALLTRYSDLRGIISPTTVGLAAAAQAVESANRAPQVQVTGLGTPNQMRRFINNGTVQAFALWDPSNVGYVSGYIGAMVALNQLEILPGSRFSTQSRGAFELGADGVVIAGPPLVFTKENIDQHQF